MVLPSACGDSGEVFDDVETGASGDAASSGSTSDGGDPAEPGASDASDSVGESDSPDPAPGDDEAGDAEPGTDDSPGPVELPEETDGLPPSDSLSPPPGWLLYAARADVDAGGRGQSFGGPNSSCSVIGQGGQIVFSATFQSNDIRNLGPHFGHTETEDVSIWGLYLGAGGERGEEWIGFDGAATLQGFEGEFALIAPGGITFDPEGEGIEPDGVAFLVTADWEGPVIENFTGEEGSGSSTIRCLFVSSELLEILGGALGD